MSKVKVSRHDVTSARTRWFEYWQKSNRAWFPFWAWLGEKNKLGTSPYVGYYMSPEAARKIAMLNGENWFTLLKAIEARTEIANGQ